MSFKNMFELALFIKRTNLKRANQTNHEPSSSNLNVLNNYVIQSPHVHSIHPIGKNLQKLGHHSIIRIQEKKPKRCQKKSRKTKNS